MAYNFPYGEVDADAFGRKRIAAPTTLFQLLYQYDTQPLFMQFNNVGTGSTVKTTSESSLTISTGGTASGASAISQTKEYFAYEPGKTQQIVVSGVLGLQKANVRSRIGYFDANNGVFFEMDGTLGACLVLRSNVGGVVAEMRVLRADWNIDQADGTGLSGATADFSKAQVFSIDFQWLGAGKIRFGLFVGNTYVFLHYIALGNTLLGPYMNTACLPVRCEITNTGVTASTTDMKEICISVISEGGQEKPILLNFGASNSTNSIIVSTRRPVLSIRPKLLFAGQVNRARLFLSDLTMLAQTTGSNLLYELVYNGTLTGAVFASVDANSGVEFDTTATAISGGTIYKTGYIATGQITPVDPVCRYPFTLNFTGSVQDIVTVVATTVPLKNTPVTAAFTWEELR
jgi:hypothetical protein